MKIAPALLTLLLVAPPLAAQTDDAYWRLWSSREERTSPRSTALGGADAALADDASAAARNPALPALLWRHEYAASIGESGLAHASVGRWSAHGYSAAAHVRRPTAASAAMAGSRLDFELTEVGVQLARRVGSRLAVGAGLSATRLTVTGESARVVAGTTLRAGAAADSTRVGAALGAVWETSRWTAAAAVHTGATFEATRTSTHGGAWDDRGTTFAVRRPWRASIGAVARPSLRVSLHAQADLRGPGTLRRAARELAAATVIAPERAGVDALRAGAQYALPLERISLIARAGVARLAEAGLRVSSAGTRSAGTAPARTRLTAGAGVAFEKTTLDVAYDGAGRWSFEIRLRRL